MLIKTQSEPGGVGADPEQDAGLASETFTLQPQKGARGRFGVAASCKPP